MKKDQHGNIIKEGDRLKDSKGEVWHIRNISGVAFLTQSDKNKIVKTKVFSKIDTKLYEIC